MLIDTNKKKINPNLAGMLKSLFGLSGELKGLQGEVDDNYLLVLPSGTKYLVKLAEEGTSSEFLEFQSALLDDLKGKIEGYQIPEVVYSKRGRAFETVNLEGQNLLLRVLTWIPGRMFASISPKTRTLFNEIGLMLGQLSLAMAEFDHPAAHRFLKWDPCQAGWVEKHLEAFTDSKQLEIVEFFLGQFNELKSTLEQLPHSVVHGDVNDYNLVVGDDFFAPSVCGIIDFGDALYSCSVSELAVCLAYSIMGQPDPLSAACHVVRAYHSVRRLTEDEIECLSTLLAIRLVVSVTCSLLNRSKRPDKDYSFISEKPAWALLEQWFGLHPNEVTYRFRAACGLEPVPNGAKLKALFESGALHLHPLVSPQAPRIPVFDMSVGSTDLGGVASYENLARFDRQVQRFMEDADVTQALGRYGETRPVYTTDHYLVQGNDGPKWRTVHLGVDLFSEPGTDVLAVLEGTVHSVVCNDKDRDYGPTIILRHEAQGVVFYTLYGHLAPDCLEALEPGQAVVRGQRIASIGHHGENGGWPPHVHFQVIADMLNFEGDFPGVAFPDELRLWFSLCPDPTSWLGYNAAPCQPQATHSLLETRKHLLGPNLSLSYDRPLHMVRGSMQYLIDVNGQRYLDTVNNVAHVGHEHPAVVAAGQRQMAVLNTNTRYLHEAILELANELLATLPDHLEVCHFVNSGSEANELALRMAEAFAGRRDMLVFESGYHGNTKRCVELSSYKFDGPGGTGAGPNVHVLPLPDFFRGPHSQEAYLDELKRFFIKVKGSSVELAGFLGESILSCGGQLPVPSRILQLIYSQVQQAGGVCIADEVQTGLGRIGTHYWAFQARDVKPDIVTIGKPLGNGHPIAAVVCTREVAKRFHNGMEYFNTFGGNPVSCRIASEVLCLIKSKKLQQHALEMGNSLMKALNDLKITSPRIGDVRGEGLFSGFEMILPETNLEPDPQRAAWIENRMRRRGVLMSVDGPDHNVLKLKPPLCFSIQDLEFFMEQLTSVFEEDPLRIT